MPIIVGRGRRLEGDNACFMVVGELKKHGVPAPILIAEALIPLVALLLEELVEDQLRVGFHGSKAPLEAGVVLVMGRMIEIGDHTTN